jgi:hypothetical protein
MRLFLALLVILSCLPLTPSYAGSMTLTTYYPAPNGNYRKISSRSVLLKEAQLTDSQQEYNCSYDPMDGLKPCPAGILYFDSDAHTLVVSDGTHWRIIPSMCIPIRACSKTLNCSSDDCGNSCGGCNGQNICSSSTPGYPGQCNQS